MKDYKNYCYEIIQDDYAESPNNWDDNEVFLVYDHRDFCVERKNFYPPEINDWMQGDDDYDFSDYYIFPVYAYIHSGVSLSLNHNGDRWDTSMRGYILVFKTLRENLTEELAKEYAESLIILWNCYLSGNVYAFKIYKKITCEHCGHIEYNLLESLYGCYGHDNCEKECINYIDNFIENETK